MPAGFLREGDAGTPAAARANQIIRRFKTGRNFRKKFSVRI
jgi:hypothetical protein